MKYDTSLYSFDLNEKKTNYVTLPPQQKILSQKMRDYEGIKKHYGAELGSRAKLFEKT